MKKGDPLAVLSLISLVLLSIHIPDDYVHGFDKHWKGRMGNITQEAT